MSAKWGLPSAEWINLALSALDLVRAMHAYERGNYLSAVRWFRRSLNLGQDKIWCWHNIALAYHALGDRAQYQYTLSSCEA